MSGVIIKLERLNEPPKTQNEVTQAKPYKRKTPCPVCGWRLFDVVDSGGGDVTVEIKCIVCKNIVCVTP